MKLTDWIDWTYAKTMWNHGEYWLAIQSVWDDFWDWFWNDGKYL
jgi:hypothetical protein